MDIFGLIVGNDIHFLINKQNLVHLLYFEAKLLIKFYGVLYLRFV